MNCFNHPETVSVAACIDCGKGLCKTCASSYALPICTACNASRVKNDKSVISKKYVPSIIGAFLGIVIAFLLTSDSYMSLGNRIITTLMFAYLFAGIPWGWFVVSFITPNMFLILSWFGWFLYFTIKFCLAFVIGVIAMPIGVGRLVYMHISANKKEQYIKNNQA